MTRRRFSLLPLCLTGVLGRLEAKASFRLSSRADRCWPRFSRVRSSSASIHYKIVKLPPDLTGLTSSHFFRLRVTIAPFCISPSPASPQVRSLPRPCFSSGRPLLPWPSNDLFFPAVFNQWSHRPDLRQPCLFFVTLFFSLSFFRVIDFPFL